MLPRDSVHGALGGQHLWVPECDSIIWTPPPRHGAAVDWARPKESWDSWKSWETLMLCSTVLHTLAFVCVWATRCDGRKLIFLWLFFRWTWVSAPWERYIYPLLGVCGTARHFVCLLPHIWVSVQGCLQGQNPFKTMYRFCTIMRITS